MLSGFNLVRVMASTALIAAGPALLADEHTEMVIRNHTGTEHSLRSTPSDDAGIITIRTTLADGTVATVERTPNGQAEVIAIPAHGTVVIDRSYPTGTTWRKFKCRRTGDDPGEEGAVWYRVAEDGNRTIHAYRTWWGLEKTDGKTIGLRTPSPVAALLFGPGCTIL